MYTIDTFDILRTALLVLVFYAANVFRSQTLIAYVSFSALLSVLYPGKNMPGQILLYTFGAFAAYIFYGIAAHQIKSRINKKSASSAPRGAVRLSLGSLLSIFTIGYIFTSVVTNRYFSFLATMIFFFALGWGTPQNRNQKIGLLWKAGFSLSIMHSIIFFGGRNLLAPAYYAGIYVIILYVFFAARDAFSIACIPEELKAGMIPAEGIAWDGKAYLFGNYPSPTLFGLLRYITGDRIQKRRVVASFFRPLSKSDVAEIQQIAKKHNKKIFLVQKKIDFMPFLIIGALAAHIFSGVVLI